MDKILNKILNWLVNKWIEATTLLGNGYATGGTISKFPHRGILMKLPNQTNPETDREKLERIFKNDVYRS